ncbi:hypothetical protein BLNAU_9259 [Blattamonas nauphoetae]|uniref:Protein kinase domain-containing protein n=1 Tax=Blattamonas nauphoetae TaxID=2049346 RepID=A0ABQ9XW62_9EUKA|nr:hypothetical protein BLNAU_9259 [Blattamonas nauphoetae]
MLGCVVSLTSSHLSGSTIRDVNTVGSVLCSNSSFSSLLHSPNTDADSSESAATSPVDSSPKPFKDGTVYSFDKTGGDTSSSANFTNCRFTGDKYQPSVRPLSFEQYPGTISILSCSFTDFSSTEDDGGVISVLAFDQFNRPSITLTSSNFTSCSSAYSGGAVWIGVVDDALITSCRFEDCSIADEFSYGGALFLGGFYREDHNHEKQYRLVDCDFADCLASVNGGGVEIGGDLDVSVVDSKFERCELIGAPDSALGGGISVYGYITLTVERALFVGCSSQGAGGAIGSWFKGNISVSDTLVKKCFSGTTGAISIFHMDDCGHLSFSHVLFDGNSVGDGTTFFPTRLGREETASKFPDLAIVCIFYVVLPTLEIDDCYTTISPDSSGMIIGETQQESSLLKPVRSEDVEFNKIGPLLTAKPTTKMNEKTGKMELEIEGITPLPSQEYEVTVKDSTGTVTRLRMLFSDGAGTLVSGSESNLKYNTSYTIISFVGVVPVSSSCRMTNDIEVPAAAWAFNLVATPDFLTFTTPEEPSITTPETPSFSTLQDTTAHLIESNPKSAFVVLHFDKEVCGSYDFFVLEDGKPVTLTITTKSCSKSGGTKEFKVIGDGKLLTHDTTYTIESLTPTPNTDSPTDVRMNETITFHIPKSSFDPKKSMSLETKQLLGWLIPLVACLLVGVLVAIIIIVLLRRRKQKKNALPAQKEMEAQEQVEFEEKVDVLADDPTRDVFHGEDRSHSAFDASSALPTNRNPSSRRVESKSMTNGDLVEVMACSGGFEVSVVGDYTTLYSVLHKEKREIGKRAIGLQIVNGLKAVLAHRQASDVVTRLSSHWIIVDSAGNVQLKLKMTSEEVELEAAQTKQQDGRLEVNGTVHNVPKDVEQAGMDGLRWRAPEVVAGGGSAVDGQKASVFSLGLVLWEIETGQVPFGELDAVNAQRQSGTGIGPKMESLQNEEFIALIQQCASANPELRPSLSEIGEFLSSHPEDSNMLSHNEKKDPTQ